VKHTTHPLSFFRLFVIISIFTLFFTLGYKIIVRYTYHYPCANSISCAKDLSGIYDAKNIIGTYNGKQVIVPPQIYISNISPLVLGESTPLDKHIYVDLAKQRLFAYEGNRLVYSFLVSTGLWGRTPTGDFHIWTKLRYTRMTGGSVVIGTYYDLPNVPYVMFFYNDEVSKSLGFSIHGTYWHDNFGHPMSHGCVNMKTEEVAKIYAWASDNPGTLITIYGTAPIE